MRYQDRRFHSNVIPKPFISHLLCKLYRQALAKRHYKTIHKIRTTVRLRFLVGVDEAVKEVEKKQRHPSTLHRHPSTLHRHDSSNLCSLSLSSFLSSFVFSFFLYYLSCCLDGLFSRAPALWLVLSLCLLCFSFAMLASGFSSWLSHLSFSSTHHLFLCLSFSFSLDG